MSVGPGTRLGQYEVLSVLGAGGMGVVYRARDTRLHREVAIKVLPEAVAQDAERLARFEREARMLASLNHANIATLHGFDSEQGTRFLVMELVDGETLADRIARGPIAVDETIGLFLQIAEGLEAAHEKGVIHRDLKPANIKVSAAGKVKILDFGLAKALVPDVVDSPADAAPSESPTMTLAATMRGEILGTAAYMSPEQAKGAAVDTRTDLWAFGVCLFESLTGRRLFGGDDAADTLAAVLRQEPRWEELPRDLPPSLLRLLRRCLVRDRRLRQQHIGDGRLDLHEALAEPAAASWQAEPPATPPARRGALPWAAAAIAGSVLAGLAAWTLKPERPSPLVRSVLSAPPSAAAVVLETVGRDLAITPDGRTVVYRVDESLYVRGVDQLQGTALPGTETGQSPFVSPDGAWLGFADAGALKKVSLRGGDPLNVCVVPGVMGSGSWAEDGTIFFSVVRGGLYRVPAGGGEPELVAEVDRDAGELLLSSPQPLPGGKALLLTVGMPFRSGGFFDSAQVAVLNLETGKRTELLQGGGSAVYVPTGHLVYAVSGGLRAVAFDPVALAVHGDPVPVLDGMVTKDFFLQADFALSSDGSLVYVSGTGSSGESTLVWVDREGREEPLGAPPANNWYPSISPEGERVAFSDLGEGLDLWIWDLRRRTRSRLTRGTAEDLYSLWTPDGREVIFASGYLPNIDLYRIASDGTGGEAERLTEHPEPLYPSSLSPDGKALVYRSGQDPPFDLGVLDLESGKTRTLLAEDFDELNGEISPDGRFLAYQSNESGRPEIYVCPFPEVEGGRWPTSTQGGAEPRWSPDGSELFYRAGDRMMAVPVRTQPTFEAGSPEELFTGVYVTRSGRMYDVSSDGKRFLMVKPTSGAEAESGGPQVVLVQNWFEELKRLVPTR